MSRQGTLFRQWALERLKNYLARHKGIEFVRDHYDVIHTLDFDYAIEDIRKVCRANGGTL